MTLGSIDRPGVGAARSSTLTSRGGPHDARLLIVDDKQFNVVLMADVFTRAGFRNLFTETDSRLVLRRLPEIDPALVILDLHMPHLDGFEVLDQIRQFAPASALPVMIVTADTTPAVCARALRAGAQDFVTKPIRYADIIIRAQNLLQASLGADNPRELPSPNPH